MANPVGNQISFRSNPGQCLVTSVRHWNIDRITHRNGSHVAAVVANVLSIRVFLDLIGKRHVGDEIVNTDQLVVAHDLGQVTQPEGFTQRISMYIPVKSGVIKRRAVPIDARINNADNDVFTF